MARIIIYRPNTFVAIAAPFIVYLDGNRFNMIKNNETQEIEIPTGIHTIQAENGIFSFGFKSKEYKFEVVEDKVNKIKIKPTLFALSGIIIKEDK